MIENVIPQFLVVLPRRIFIWILGCLLLTSALSVRGELTREDVAVGIKKHIEDQTRKGRGKFRLKDGDRDLALTLVKVHNDKLAVLENELCFACVDMKADDGTIYDIDFFLSGDVESLKVTETILHKVNRNPRYGWEKNSEGKWVRVPANPAVIRNEDQFEFTYRVALPEISGKGKLWVPLIKEDSFQKVKLKKISSEELEWKQIQDQKEGNQILFFKLEPSATGKIIELSYDICRKEKTAYSDDKIDPSNQISSSGAIDSNQ